LVLNIFQTAIYCKLQRRGLTFVQRTNVNSTPWILAPQYIAYLH